MVWKEREIKKVEEKVFVGIMNRKVMKLRSWECQWMSISDEVKEIVVKICNDERYGNKYLK